MTYLFGGSVEDQFTAFFEHLNGARQGGEQGHAEFVEALATLVGVVDRHARTGAPAPDRVAEFWRDACTSLATFADDLSAYAHVTSIIAEGANDNEWYQLCLRRSAIQIVVDHCPLVTVITGDELVELDGELRRVGTDQGPVPEDYIPQGLAATHWWWRYPTAEEGRRT